MKNTIGTCSICGGRVSVPQVWHGIIPPTPTCEACGAVAAETYGPVIPMQRPQFDIKISDGTGLNPDSFKLVTTSKWSGDNNEKP